MISLKSFLPVLSKHTDVSVTALYERQRALVRLGLFPAPTQSGRNSGGAMATPGNVGIMLLSVLVTDRLSEVDERMFDYLALKPSSFPDFPGAASLECCTFTGAPYLYRSLQRMLDPRFPDIVTISVDRKRRLVHLESPDPERDEPCTFGTITSNLRLQHLVVYDALDELSRDLWLCNEPPEVRANSTYWNPEID